MTWASEVALRALGVQVVVDDSQSQRGAAGAVGAHLQPPQPLRWSGDSGGAEAAGDDHGPVASQMGAAWLRSGGPQCRLGGVGPPPDAVAHGGDAAGLRLLREHGQIMLAPNGSLVTPIEAAGVPQRLDAGAPLRRPRGALGVPLRRDGGGSRARYKPWHCCSAGSRRRWGRFTASADVPVIWCSRTIPGIAMDSPEWCRPTTPERSAEAVPPAPG